MGKSQVRIDEFAFVLLAGLILIIMLAIAWTTPPEAAPLVEPSTIKLTLQPGTTSLFTLNISGRLTNVTLIASGEIKNWLTFEKNFFDVYDSTIVKITVKVPKGALIKTYSGTIEVSSLGGKKIVQVSIDVTNITIPVILASRPIFLYDFVVSYAVGTEVLASKENFEVVKGYFADYSQSISALVSEEKLLTITEAYLKITVEETNKAGNLIVLFNEDEVLNKKVDKGEILVPINKTLIKKVNTITLRAGLPGWKFWVNTVYKIREMKFLISYKGIFAKEVAFNLNKYEVNNFDHFQLIYKVKNHSAILPELKIKINAQIVFMQKPPLAFFNATFDKDVLGNKLYLMEGENTIGFSFEREAFYEVTDAMLIIFYRL